MGELGGGGWHSFNTATYTDPVNVLVKAHDSKGTLLDSAELGCSQPQLFQVSDEANVEMLRRPERRLLDLAHHVDGGGKWIAEASTWVLDPHPQLVASRSVTTVVARVHERERSKLLRGCDVHWYPFRCGQQTRVTLPPARGAVSRDRSEHRRTRDTEQLGQLRHRVLAALVKLHQVPFLRAFQHRPTALQAAALPGWPSHCGPIVTVTNYVRLSNALSESRQH